MRSILPPDDDQTEELELPPPPKVGRFSVGDPFGSGSEAIVYAATDADGGRYALKIVRRSALADNAALTRFNNELDTLEKVDHPHIVSIVDKGELEDGRPWFAMPMYDGGSLESKLSGGQTFAPLVAVEIAFRILSGLQAVHALGVIHRDVRPANVLLDEAGSPVLLDFGVARMNPDLEEAIVTRTGDDLGIVGYVAEEQRGDPHNVGPEADVYSVGCLLYAMVAGQSPVHLVVMDQNPRVLAPVPALIRPVIERAAAYDRKERFPSVREMATELAAVYDAVAQQADVPQLGEQWMEEFSRLAPVEVPKFEDPRTHREDIPPSELGPDKGASPAIIGAVIVMLLLVVALAGWFLLV